MQNGIVPSATVPQVSPAVRTVTAPIGVPAGVTTINNPAITPTPITPTPTATPKPKGSLSEWWRRSTARPATQDIGLYESNGRLVQPNTSSLFQWILVIVIVAIVVILIGLPSKPQAPSSSVPLTLYCDIAADYTCATAGPNDRAQFRSTAECEFACIPSPRFGCGLSEISAPGGNVLTYYTGTCVEVHATSGETYNTQAECEAAAVCPTVQAWYCDPTLGCTQTGDGTAPYINRPPNNLSGSTSCAQECVSKYFCNSSGVCTDYGFSAADSYASPGGTSYSLVSGTCSTGNTCSVQTYSCGEIPPPVTQATSGATTGVFGCVGDAGSSQDCTTDILDACCATNGGTACGYQCCPSGQKCCTANGVSRCVPSSACYSVDSFCNATYLCGENAGCAYCSPTTGCSDSVTWCTQCQVCQPIGDGEFRCLSPVIPATSTSPAYSCYCHRTEDGSTPYPSAGCESYWCVFQSETSTTPKCELCYCPDGDSSCGPGTTQCDFTGNGSSSALGVGVVSENIITVPPVRAPRVSFDPNAPSDPPVVGGTSITNNRPLGANNPRILPNDQLLDAYLNAGKRPAKEMIDGHRPFVHTN